MASFKLLFKQKIWFISVSTNYLYDANVITQSSGGSRIFLRGRQLLKWGCQPIITGRNEVVAKVIFLHLSVIHSVHRGGGGLPQCMLGYPPGSSRPTPPPGPDPHPPRPGRPPGTGRPEESMFCEPANMPFEISLQSNVHSVEEKSTEHPEKQFERIYIL